MDSVRLANTSNFLNSVTALVDETATLSADKKAQPLTNELLEEDIPVNSLKSSLKMLSAQSVIRNQSLFDSVIKNPIKFPYEIREALADELLFIQPKPKSQWFKIRNLFVSNTEIQSYAYKILETKEVPYSFKEFQYPREKRGKNSEEQLLKHLFLDMWNVRREIINPDSIQLGLNHKEILQFKTLMLAARILKSTTFRFIVLAPIFGIFSLAVAIVGISLSLLLGYGQYQLFVLIYKTAAPLLCTALPILLQLKSSIPSVSTLAWGKFTFTSGPLSKALSPLFIYSLFLVSIPKKWNKVPAVLVTFNIFPALISFTLINDPLKRAFYEHSHKIYAKGLALENTVQQQRKQYYKKLLMNSWIQSVKTQLK